MVSEMAVATSIPTNSSLSNELVNNVRASLGRLSYQQLNDVDCSVDGENNVTLTGSLKSYYLKQIAQAIAIKVPGVGQVNNQILVRD